ncbi:MAG: methionine--tRNA ligase [Actinomycetota bacterium]
MSEEVFYVTTPIYYPNADPHIGSAYTTVAGDFLARFRRLQGREVHYLTGTDEHGQRMLQTAEAAGMKPLDFLDSIVPRYKEAWAALDIAYDDFIRTTEERHETAVAAFVQDLHDRGEIYLGTYEGLYCVGCEAFKLPDELVDGKCPLHDTVPDVVKEENYFFRLSKYQDRLIDLYENSDPPFVQPESRRNEVLGKVRQGLDDLSISRVSFDWGVPIPWDTKHVIYVWVDALQNYITAIGYGWDDPNFRRIWPADVHLIGKDILWFHTVIWPAMLMAVEVPLPTTVFAHGYLQVGGQKMSKSRATAIHPSELTKTFGVDGYRYHFMRDFSFGQDGNFSWEGMAARYNSDLANEFGNLASRVLSMIDRYLGGSIPSIPGEGETTGSDRDLQTTQERSFAEMEAAVDAVSPSDALKSCWSFVRKANAYVEEVAPWALAKDDAQRRRLEVVLYHLADSLRLLALMTSPIMPRVAQELWSRLGLDGDVVSQTYSESLRWGLLPEGSKVRVGDPLFPKVEEE